jgi:4'-phosphopantetheinyl transferase
MAFAPGFHGPPAFYIGVDVMKIRAPRGEGIASFLRMMGDTVSEPHTKPSIMIHQFRR